MWKLIIVDDEPLVVTGLKTMLQWSEYDIEVTASAYNGQDALTCIEKYHPDIVIADIKMPVIDGIELMRICKERYGSRPVFILLSSYEDFSYAKEAVHYEAVEYLLKMEINQEILIKALEAAVDRLRSMNAVPALSIDFREFYDKFFIRLLYHLFETQEQYEAQKELLGLEMNYAAYVCVYCRIETPSDIPPKNMMTLCQSTLSMMRQLLMRYCMTYTISLDMEHFVIVFCLNDEQYPDYQRIIRDILDNVTCTIHNYFNLKLRIAAGQAYPLATNIAISFREAHRLVYTAVPGASVIFYTPDLNEVLNNLDSPEMKNIKDRLTKSLEEYNNDLLIQSFDDLVTFFNKTMPPQALLLDTASNILFMSISLLPDGEKTVPAIFSDEQDGYRSLYRLTTFEQVIHWLYTLRDGLCRIFNNKKRDYKKSTVFEVQKYIQNNLNKKLSLNEVADAFGLSPNYLSSIFKKNCDYSFTEYINHSKVNAAKKMLSEGNLKIYEISRNLGFEDAFYFSKVFKKIEGCSPTEYLHHI